MREHTFPLQRCTDCAALRHPAREVCGRCRSFAWAWTPALGTGTVDAWTTTHRAVHPAFAGLVPYTVLRVRLDDAPGLWCWGGLAAAADPGVLRAGLPVRAVFTDADADLTLIDWAPR
ncbi:Zn-ribbon domain-containing OB-fold protein [Nocardiopsis sediminis]|uniref:Zn-ribbon domain-containing OB-fold protein n=1 Tax=Nocardiopsis sediminis TaxID=1778267 RepID=A0ABV8FXP9_9ACTN